MVTDVLSCVFWAGAILQLVSGMSDMKCPKKEVQNCNCMQGTYLFRGPYMRCSEIGDVETLRNTLLILMDNPIDGLQLDNISLPCLPRAGLFKGTYVQYLWLSYSDFQYIAPPDVKGPSPFEGLEDSVTQMKIEGMQKLVSLDWSEFSSLKKLYRIEMYNLNLEVIDQSFSKLPSSFRNFNLLMGHVKSIAPGAFNLDGITSVAVELNTIDRLDRNIFGKNANLSYIRFSQNQLKELSDDFFDNLPALNFIDIGRNKLTRLPSSLETNWDQFENIYMAGNPLTCDCDLVWLLNAAKTRPPKYGDLEFVKCGSPSRLAGRELLTLNEADLCP